MPGAVGILGSSVIETGRRLPCSSPETVRPCPASQPDASPWRGCGSRKGRHMFDIRSITVDCADPYRQAVFWSAVTGWQEDPDDPNHPDDPEGRIVSTHGIS